MLGGAYKGLLFALYLKNVLGEKITIVTYKKDHINYCKAKNIDYIQFEYVSFNLFSFYKIFTFKKRLDNLIKKINLNEEDRFFLLPNAKACDSFYLAKELSKKGKGYFKNPDRELAKYKPPRFKPIFFRGAVIRFLLKLFMDLDLMYYEGNSGNPYIGIDEKFLKKHGIIEYAPEVSAEDLILKMAKKTKINSINEYDNLIIGPAALVDYITLESIEKVYNYLLELPPDFAIKKRPVSRDLKNPSEISYNKLFKNCEEIPRYIPIELLYNNVRKNIIAIFSTSLIPASQIDHLNAISLLELVDWYNDSSKKFFKDHLLKLSNSKILFPKNFEELKEIILN